MDGDLSKFSKHLCEDKRNSSETISDAESIQSLSDKISANLPFASINYVYNGLKSNEDNVAPDNSVKYTDERSDFQDVRTCDTPDLSDQLSTNGVIKISSDCALEKGNWNDEPERVINNLCQKANTLYENDCFGSDNESLSSVQQVFKINNPEDINIESSSVPIDTKESERLRKELEEELQSFYGENPCLSRNDETNSLPDGSSSEDESVQTTSIPKNAKARKRLKKDLEEELQSIHSENQRLARDTKVNLPYHKPKISSLSDFLNRKSATKSNFIRPTKLTTIKSLPVPDTETIETSLTPPIFKTPEITEFKHNLLRSKGLTNTTPKLCMQSNFVELELGETPKGLSNLMSRFIKHNQKKTEGSPQEMKMHLVCKDLDKDGHEDLKAKEITVKIQSDINGQAFNYQNFGNFKEQLLSTITRKKLEKQEKLIATCELDNEEGFEEDESSDEGESDDGALELEDVFKEGHNSKNCEPVNDDKDDCHNTMENSEVVYSESKEINSKFSSLDKPSIPKSGAHTDSQHLFLENSTELPTGDIKICEDEMDTSFELVGSLIPAHQPGGGLKNGGYDVSDDEACTLETSNRTDTIFRQTSLEYDSEFESPECHTVKESLVFSKDEGTDSQNFHELLSLCSGRFESQSKNTVNNSNFKSPVSSRKNIFQKNESSDSQCYNELLALCSGKFSGKNMCSQTNETILEANDSGTVGMSNQSHHSDLLPNHDITNKNSDTSISDAVNASADDDDDDNEIHLTWKKVARKKNLKLNFDSDDECPLNENVECKEKMSHLSVESEEEEEADDDDDSEGHKSQTEEPINEDGENAIPEVTKVADFFEEEAELSGSDVGSDDEMEDDEDEEIFTNEVPSDEEMTSEELRNQIGKIHMKKLMDDDKREVRFFQEVYLEDGDLHSEGNGRERKFRWLNVDYGKGDVEDKEEGSADEMEPNTVESEKWRLERFEREKWLQEQETLNNESWTGFKLIKRNKESGLGTPNINYSPTTFPSITNQPKSFLAKNKEFCSRLAEKIHKQESEHVGRRSTKNFVFISKSPAKPAKRNGEPVQITVAKIRKLNTPKLKDISKKSIFNFI